VEELQCACKAVTSVVNTVSDTAAVDYYVTWLLPRCVATVIRACCVTSEVQRDVVVTELSAAARTVVRRSSEWLASEFEPFL
jgi:hypothetical protein